MFSWPCDDMQMALELGVDSVMVDGSAWEYEKNVEWTAKMTRLAHDKVLLT